MRCNIQSNEEINDRKGYDVANSRNGINRAVRVVLNEIVMVHKTKHGSLCVGMNTVRMVVFEFGLEDDTGRRFGCTVCALGCCIVRHFYLLPPTRGTVLVNVFQCNSFACDHIITIFFFFHFNTEEKECLWLRRMVI